MEHIHLLFIFILSRSSVPSDYQWNILQRHRQKADNEDVLGDEQCVEQGVWGVATNHNRKEQDQWLVIICLQHPKH